jgi:predicted O-methyltransferase YrrM
MDRILDIKEYAKENNVPIMQDAGIDFMCEYIKDNNIKSILEIGSAIGYSAIRFAKVNDNIKVTTIERDDSRYNEAVKNISSMDLDSRITIYHRDALEININDKFDMIFIDAAKSQYIKFFEKFKNNLNDNGVIFSDNLKFHGFVDHPELTHNRNTRQLVGKIRKYVDFLKDNKEFTTTFYNIGDGVSISKKNN